MKLQNLSLSACVPSKTNPRGKDFSGPSYDDLVKSVREKGVLVPIMVREKRMPQGDIYYEVIAGHRRLKAAYDAGLAEIPATVVEMSDTEVRETQIVENLQREDVHPLEEGEAYRALIEESKYDTASVAAKVGKAESYVKQRLFLTNLARSAADAYRSGKIIDGHAVLIAKLSTNDQARALKAATNRYNTMTVKELKEWVAEKIYSPLESQPWLGGKEAAAAAGKCQECEPEKASLFGPVKEGACTSLKCWARKMEAYIAWRVKEGKLARVSSEYGQAPKGVYGRSEFVLVAKAGKDRCKSAHPAITVNGADVGKEADICTDQHCGTHRGMKSQYGMTPKEQEKRREEQRRQRKAEERRRAKDEKEFAAGIKKIKHPLTEKVIDALLWLAIDGHGPQMTRPIAKRNEIEAREFTRKNWDGKMVKERDFGASLLDAAKKMDASGKAKLLVEALIQDSYGDKRKKFFERI